MLNVLDLFAGIGGFSLGLERTGGFRTVAFCEIDKKAQRVLNKHWPDTPIFDDVSALTKDLIDETVGTPIHVITGGFPCQDISLAGKGAGLDGERSGLWFQFHRLIEEFQPRYAIIENVSALRSRGLEVVLGGLAEIGYDAEWHCIPAAAVGAPHRRDRVWVVAYPRQLCGRRVEPQQGSNWGDTIASGHGPQGSAGDMANPRISDRADAQADSQRADANGFGSHRTAVNVEGSAEPGYEQVGVVGSLGEILADRLRARLEGHAGNGAEFREPQQDGSTGPQGVRGGGHPSWWWEVEPDVGRVADGVPNRVDRLKQLGNAVVPQIPQLLGEAILDWEQSRAN